MLCRRVSLDELHPALGGGAPETGLDIYCRGRTGLLADDGARWAVLILPGGGYERIAPAEGEPVALAFVAAGIQAFVLSYSVLPALWPRQFLEGAAALAWMRANALELGFRPAAVLVSLGYQSSNQPRLSIDGDTAYMVMTDSGFRVQDDRNANMNAEGRAYLYLAFH